jgi:cell division protein FtsB
MSDFFDWLGVSGVFAMLGGAIGLGQHKAKISALEKELADLRAGQAEFRSVSDTVIRIEEQIKTLHRDVGNLADLMSRPRPRSRTSERPTA